MGDLFPSAGTRQMISSNFCQALYSATTATRQRLEAPAVLPSAVLRKRRYNWLLRACILSSSKLGNPLLREIQMELGKQDLPRVVTARVEGLLSNSILSSVLPSSCASALGDHELTCVSPACVVHLRRVFVRWNSANVHAM